MSPFYLVRPAQQAKNILLVIIILLFVSLCSDMGNTGSEQNVAYVVNGSVKLFCKTIGSGEPLVIIHGGPGLDHSYLLPQMEALANNFKLIFYDQRGSGRSIATPDSASMTMDMFVSDLEAIRSHFNLHELNLLGHSWGALLATNYAFTYPDKVNSLILTSSPGVSSESMVAFNQEIAKRTIPDVQEALQQLMGMEAFTAAEPEAMEEFVRLTFQPYFHEKKMIDSLSLHFTNLTAKNLLPIYTTLLSYLMSYDHSGSLGNIDCPTLIIHGNDDPIPLRFAYDLCDHLTNAEILVIKESGHFPFIESPESYFRGLNDFLARVF